MQRLLFSILLSFFVFASCSKSLPEGILSEKEMISLLQEVHLTDAYMNTLMADSSKKIINSLYSNIFNQYGLDSASFAMNMDYYLSQPTLAEKIYDNVLIKMREDQRAIAVKDSLFQVRMQDSTIRIQRLAEDYHFRKNLIANVYIDSSKLTYQNVQESFFSRIPLRLNVYGRDIPTQPLANMTNIPHQDSITKISVLTDSLSTDSVQIDSLPVKQDSGIQKLLNNQLFNSPIPLRSKPVYR